MTNVPRPGLRTRCLLALAVVLAFGSHVRLADQSILFEPGSVNASISDGTWWLANTSIVATWTFADGGFRLASIYDRLGGRPAPRISEAV